MKDFGTQHEMLCNLFYTTENIIIRYYTNVATPLLIPITHTYTVIKF